MVCYSFPQKGGNYEYRRFKKTDCCFFMVSLTHNLKRLPIWITKRNQTKDQSEAIGVFTLNISEIAN